MDQQLRSNWARLLDSLLELAHPLLSQITSRMKGLHYYWSASQSEYATYILSLTTAKISSDSIRNLSTTRLKLSTVPTCCVSWVIALPLRRGKVHGCFQGQVTTSLKERPEGVRLRHKLNGNSLKI